MKGVILQGSSRSTGNTAKVVNWLAQETGYDIIDLRQLDIGHYDYEDINQTDDFLPLMRKLVNNYEVLIFATPVYWYTMSGIMKVFFDRITDCLKIEKETGRKLRGMSMGMVSCSEDSELNTSFAVPFRESADYLGMTYLGDIHTWIDEGKIADDAMIQLRVFAHKLKN